MILGLTRFLKKELHHFGSKHLLGQRDPGIINSNDITTRKSSLHDYGI